ncbi:MAG: hypothetical protein PHH11_08165 [Methylomonas sp.]|nr:hypothetical protein [Methylomonas sp.]
MFKAYILLIAGGCLPLAAAAELRDPTQPGHMAVQQASGETVPEAGLNLTAIWISDSGRRATINGNTVSAGQTLPDGSRVLKIRQSHVWIRQNGVSKKIHLVPSVKQTVK